MLRPVLLFALALVLLDGLAAPVDGGETAAAAHATGGRASTAPCGVRPVAFDLDDLLLPVVRCASGPWDPGASADEPDEESLTAALPAAAGVASAADPSHGSRLCGVTIRPSASALSGLARGPPARG